MADLLLTLSNTADKHAQQIAVAEYCARVGELAAQRDSMSAEELQWLTALRDPARAGKLETLRRVASPVHPVLVDEIRTLSLTSDDESVRIASIDKLVDIQGEGAVGALVTIATAEGALPVRAEAVLALRAMGGAITKEAVQSLSSTMSTNASLAPLFRHEN
ncbi:MAG: hypothetical protein WCB10_18480 [Steroidobacteraceae bacterium]